MHARLSLVVLVVLAVSCGGGNGGSSDAGGEPGIDLVTDGDGAVFEDGRSVKTDGTTPDDGVGIPDQSAPDVFPPDDVIGEDSPELDDAVIPDSLLDSASTDTGKPDTGTPGGSLSVAAPTQWQRGPVTLLVTLDGEGTFAGEVEFAVGQSALQAATPMTGFSDDLNAMTAGTWRFVWNSMVDVGEDVDEVSVVVTATSGDMVLHAEAAPFPLRNDPARDRIALITSSINGNNKVRRLVFSHGAGFSFDGNVIEVGESPVDVAFHPGGISAVTLDQGSDSMTFFAIGDDGSAVISGAVSADGHNLERARFALDGSGLYLMDYNSIPGAGLFLLELDPHTGLPGPGAGLQMLSEHKGAQAFDLFPNNGGYAVLSTVPGLGGLVLSLHGSDGTLIVKQEFGPEGSLPRSVAISHYGDILLTAHGNLFGEIEAVTLFTYYPDGALEQMGQVEVADPEEVEFAADGMSAVVSEAWDNKVTLVQVGGGIALSKKNSVKVDLATRIASPRWGPDADRFFVATVSATTGESGLAVVSYAGNSISLDETFSLGGGNDVIPGSVDVQP